MAIITLTTDFGIKDHFVGAVKGAIYSELPDATIVDITHSISPFNIKETAYVIKNAYKSFPKSTIHIIGVDSELSAHQKHLALEVDGQYFICPDNGVICMITKDVKPTKIVEINIHDRVESSFPVLDVFVQVACFISRGGNLGVIGKEISSFKEVTNIQPRVNTEENRIIGNVLYVDNYGNIISNISKKLFKEIGKGRPFTVFAKRHRFTKIYRKYNEIVPVYEKNTKLFEGSKLAIFNSAGFLELAIYKSNLGTVGGASSLLGINLLDQITIEFN